MPIALVAVTVNVYVVPLVNPMMVVLVAGGEPVTVTGVWAVRADERRDRVAGDRAAAVRTGPSRSPSRCRCQRSRVTLVGRAGAVGRVGVTAFDGADGGPVPIALVAVTVNV